MSTAALFVTAFVVAFSGAMMPGPLLTVTITESTRRGFKAGPLLILGHALLELALVAALLSGLSHFLQNPIVTAVISIVGGAFLFFIGYKMVRDAVKGKITLTENYTEADGSTSMHPVAAGVLISLSNPYWVIWWATVGLTYLTMSLKNGIIGAASFFTGHILADLLWYSLISAVIAGGRRFINQQIYKAVIIVCGLFLIVLGCYFFSAIFQS